tara:strand:- start:7763 stop:8965 length:1203 start_codon:yes stop_codon:yes gene_type:complete
MVEQKNSSLFYSIVSPLHNCSKKLRNRYKYVLALFLTLALPSFVAAQINVPDSAFREQLKTRYAITFDTENNITNPESAANLEELLLYTDISNLKGIEAFTSLKILESSGAKLTSVDLSANEKLTRINLGLNSLTSIDLSSNTALTHLSVCCNQLTSIDLSANKALESLAIYSNQLTNLDLSSNTLLTSLSCNDNHLKSLEVSFNKNLQALHCEKNQLTRLDLSSNQALTFLNCSNNQLTSLELSSKAAINRMECKNNQLSSLNLWNTKLHFTRQWLLYENNNFPFYYNSFFPFQKNMVIQFLGLLPVFIIYIISILFLVYQKHQDEQKNKRMNRWIFAGNIILLPAWYFYLSDPFISNTYMVLYVVAPFLIVGVLIQLKSLILKTIILLKRNKTTANHS